jgi:hypothetical protein
VALDLGIRCNLVAEALDCEACRPTGEMSFPVLSSSKEKRVLCVFVSGEPGYMDDMI